MIDLANAESFACRVCHSSNDVLALTSLIRESNRVQNAKYRDAWLYEDQAAVDLFTSPSTIKFNGLSKNVFCLEGA